MPEIIDNVIPYIGGEEQKSEQEPLRIWGHVENGEIAIVLIDGEEATAKEVKESADGITLIGHNTAVYTPHFYSAQEVKNLPVQIIGRVVQSIRKF